MILNIVKLLRLDGRRQGKLSNGDRLDIIICQNYAMMSSSQLESFKKYYDKMRG